MIDTAKGINVMMICLVIIAYLSGRFAGQEEGYHVGYSIGKHDYSQEVNDA